MYLLNYYQYNDTKQQLYWVSAIAQDSDKDTYLLSMYDSETSLEDAMETIRKTRISQFSVLSAWIDVFDENNVKQTIFHECYINAIGKVEKICDEKPKNKKKCDNCAFSYKCSLY